MAKVSGNSDTVLLVLLVNSKDGKCFKKHDYDTLLHINMVGIVGGIVLCICGIYIIVELLYDTINLFYAATLGIVILGISQAYAACYSLTHPCVLFFVLFFFVLLIGNNDIYCHDLSHSLPSRRVESQSLLPVSMYSPLFFLMSKLMISKKRLKVSL